MRKFYVARCEKSNRGLNDRKIDQLETKLLFARVDRARAQAGSRIFTIRFGIFVFPFIIGQHVPNHRLITRRVKNPFGYQIGLGEIPLVYSSSTNRFCEKITETPNVVNVFRF